MDLKYLHQDEADEMEWGCIKLKDGWRIWKMILTGCIVTVKN